MTPRRRRFARLAFWPLVLGGILFSGLAQASGSYPETKRVLKTLYAANLASEARFLAFAEKAEAEGRLSIARIFWALAVSERVQARNTHSVLSVLGENVSQCATRQRHTIGSTRQNLLEAMQLKRTETEAVLPEALARLQTEGHPEAIRSVSLALKARRHQREAAAKLMWWTRHHFKRMAAYLREKNPVYYVCRETGAIATGEIPPICPVRLRQVFTYAPVSSAPATLLTCQR